MNDDAMDDGEWLFADCDTKGEVIEEDEIVNDNGMDDGEWLFADYDTKGEGQAPFASGAKTEGQAPVVRHDAKDAGPGTADVDDLRILVERARRGDGEALPRLRAILDERPDLWRHAADLAACAEGAWIALIGGADAYLRESLRRRIAELKGELAGAAPPSPLERLLIDRIAVCWLMTNYADISYAQGKDLAIKVAQLALDRQDRTQRRLLAAIAALAALRKTPPRGQAGPEGQPRAVASSYPPAAGHDRGIVTGPAGRGVQAAGQGRARASRRPVAVFPSPGEDARAGGVPDPIEDVTTKARPRTRRK